MAGTGLVWLGFFVAALFAGMGMVAVGAGEPLGWPVAIVCSLASVIALVVQVRFSPVRAARVIGPALLVPGTILLVVALGTSSISPLIGAAFAVPGVALAAYGFAQRREVLPGLWELLPGANVFESSDVQFAVSWANEPLSIGGYFRVKVHAQCVIDAPRHLQISLRGDRHLFDAPHAVKVDLAPGTVVEASVPFRLASVSSASPRLVVDVMGFGDHLGRRLTRRTGAAYLTTEDVQAGNALAVIQLLTVGGTATLHFGPGAGAADVPVDTEACYSASIEEMAVKELFRPTPEQLALAARS